MVAVPAVLTRDVGPLPVWGWVAAAGGGVALGVWWRRRTVASTGRTAAPSAGPAEVIYSPALGGVSGSAGLAPAPAAPEPVEMSNNDWRRQALRIAIDQGYTPSTADSILSLYFDGEPLTADQTKLLDLVIPTIGLPPDPPSIRPAPAPGAPTPTDPGTDPLVSDGVGDTINRGYQEVLGRQADAGGLAYWRTLLGGGTINEDQFRSQLANSTEANNRIVADAYRSVLRREAAPSEVAYWSGEITAGRLSSSGITSQLEQSPEYRQRIAGN